MIGKVLPVVLQDCTNTSYMGRYSFSGHESFFCKPLWLKKAYDAMNDGVNFSSPDAVAALGVGKNMVASIRFWSRAFGLCVNDIPTHFATSIFDSKSGYDPYLEDEGTLWLLHYYLLIKKVASLYHLTFLDFQREKREFDRNQLLTFVRRKCNVPEQKNVYNENTVKKDIGVLLHNYVMPTDIRSNEDFSAIFLDLGLINALGSDRYSFNETDPSHIHPDILLYVLLDYKGEDNTISLDGMQDVALVFGLSLTNLIELIREVVAQHPEDLSYTDNSGVKNLQFIHDIDAAAVLYHYYTKA